MQANVLKLQLRNKSIIDPAVEAYYAVENALDAEEFHDGSECDTDNAHRQFAGAVPTTMEGVKRKIEMDARWNRILESTDEELTDCDVIAEYLALMQVNTETMIAGLAKILA